MVTRAKNPGSMTNLVANLFGCISMDLVDSFSYATPVEDQKKLLD